MRPTLGDLSTALNGLFISVGSTCGRSLSFLAIVYGQHCREIQTEPSEVDQSVDSQVENRHCGLGGPN